MTTCETLSHYKSSQLLPCNVVYNLFFPPPLNTDKYNLHKLLLILHDHTEKYPPVLLLKLTMEYNSNKPLMLITEKKYTLLDSNQFLAQCLSDFE